MVLPDTVPRSPGVDRDALRDAWPIMLGIAPFGSLIGVVIGHTGVGAGLGLGSSAGVAIGIAWLACNAVGVVLGPVLPLHSPLGIAAAAVFVGLLVPQLRTRPAVLAAAAAAAVAAAGSGLPPGLGLVTGALAGLCVAALVERPRPDSTE